MTTTNYKKQLDILLPFGMVATNKWFASNGISRHSRDNALKSKKLVSLTPGVYARVGVPVTWQGIVSSVQRMSSVPVHVGGLTALDLLGFGHYLSNSSKKTIHLYSTEKLPKWLSKITEDTHFQTYTTKKIWHPDLMSSSKFVREQSWQDNLPALLISTPEKAYLEMLSDVPKKVSFEHADEIMQGLTGLSPRRVDILLRGCKHIKVKRLFFWFATRQNYSWFQKLNIKDYELGKGNRLVAEGGKLDKDLLITVPKHLHEYK